MGSSLTPRATIKPGASIRAIAAWRFALRLDRHDLPEYLSGGLQQPEKLFSAEARLLENGGKRASGDVFAVRHDNQPDEA